MDHCPLTKATRRRLENRVLLTEGRVTSVDGLLATAVLIGGAQSRVRCVMGGPQWPPQRWVYPTSRRRSESACPGSIPIFFLRVCLVFGHFETAMPLVGLLIDRRLARSLGHDNLVVGLALGTHKVSLSLAAAVIAVASVWA